MHFSIFGRVCLCVTFCTAECEMKEVLTHLKPLLSHDGAILGAFVACKEENTPTYAHTHTHPHTQAGVCAWSVGYGPRVGLSLPVIYKGISPLSSSLFLTQPQGLDSLLTNNIAANGPEPAVDLPADHTHAPTQSPLSGFTCAQSPRRKSLWRVCQNVLKSGVWTLLLNIWHHCILTRWSVQ